MRLWRILPSREDRNESGEKIPDMTDTMAAVAAAAKVVVYKTKLFWETEILVTGKNGGLLHNIAMHKFLLGMLSWRKWRAFSPCNAQFPTGHAQSTIATILDAAAAAAAQKTKPQKTKAPMTKAPMTMMMMANSLQASVLFFNFLINYFYDHRFD